jgi:hypothetical protein
MKQSSFSIFYIEIPKFHDLIIKKIMEFKLDIKNISRKISCTYDCSIFIMFNNDDDLIYIALLFIRSVII